MKKWSQFLSNMIRDSQSLEFSSSRTRIPHPSHLMIILVLVSLLYHSLIPSTYVLILYSAQTWPSAPSIPNELALTPVVSPTTQKGQPIILTYHPFTNETTTTHSQLAAMHPNTTMMPTAQPATQAYHLPNTSANDTSPETTAYSNPPSMSIQPLPAPNTVLTTYHPPQPSTSEAGTLHPEVAAALDTISRAKLTTDQRQALITSLNSPVETAPEPPDLLRSNTLSSPPPYQE